MQTSAKSPWLHQISYMPFWGVRILGGKELLDEGMQTVAKALGAFWERRYGSFDDVCVNFK